MEKVNEVKYLGSIFCKHGSMEGEVRKKELQGRKEVGSLGYTMKGWTVNKEIKKTMSDCIIVPMLTDASET